MRWEKSFLLRSLTKSSEDIKSVATQKGICLNLRLRSKRRFHQLLAFFNLRCLSEKNFRNQFANKILSIPNH